MGSSAMTNSHPTGSGDVASGLFGLPPTVALPQWRRRLRIFVNARHFDWLVAALVIGCVHTVADPWNARQTAGSLSADAADGLGWIRAIAGLALTSATALAAFVMLQKRRSLLAAGDSPPETAPGGRGEPGSLTVPAHAAHDLPPPQPESDDAAAGDPAHRGAMTRVLPAIGRTPGAADPPCLAWREPETGHHPDEAARAAVPALHAERIQALGQLAAGIAHDFNNLLTAMHGGASLIARHAEDPAATRRYAGMILDATARGQSITRRLLSFARREETLPEPVDPKSVLHALHQIASHSLGPLIAVRVESPSPLPRLLADRGELETALVNLAVNARDAMPEGGTLTFAAALEVVAQATIRPAVGAAGTYIRISVSDTGVGIDPSLLDRVMEPFFTTKPPGQGTGLGLPMAKAFAEQSGGGLTIDSSPGRGTTVSLWLPVADSVFAAPAATRVLLAEDDPMVSETLAAVLDDAGYAVALARSGAEALAILRSPGRVDALITDLSIRELGGLALIHEAQRCRPGLPAILLTACPDTDAALAMKGAFSGAFSLLRKPVSAAYLFARIEALIAAEAG